jgi:DNA ligase-1
MKKNTPFSKFADLCERLAATTKRLEKIAMLAEFLQALTEDELVAAARFVLGKVFPDYDPRTLDVSWKTLQKVRHKIKPQAHDQPLTILEVANLFTRIAETSGKGSRQRIHELLEALFNRAGQSELDSLVKIIFGEMRIGVAEGVLLEGIAKAADAPLQLVRRANMYLGDPGEVARVALRSGANGLARINLQLFRPVQPMLAELAEEFSEVFNEHGGKTSLEFKFDGARVQIHKQNDQVRIYSRHLSEVTASLPDVVEMIGSDLRAKTAIVEGEVVAVGKDERPLPFQELMRRFRRVHQIDATKREVPVKLYLFDLLLLDGVSQVNSPYLKRWEILTRHCAPELLAKRIITDDQVEAEKFLRQALEKGHEGLMAKKLDSEYTPGARAKRWFKIKPAETLDLVIIAAEWGSGRRVGWLSNYHLAARDETSDEFFMLGKTFKGLTDDEFKWMTQKLLSLKIGEDRYTVYVKPQLVVEVAYNEIQRSPQYNSKFALRFARIKRIREDKSPRQADTIARVRRLYEQQFERKAKAENVAKFK